MYISERKGKGGQGFFLRLLGMYASALYGCMDMNHWMYDDKEVVLEH